MPERLTDSLVRRGLVTRRAADDAMDRLVLMGGALDTCLLELQLVDETELLDGLRAAYETEVASFDVLATAADDRATRTFPEQWAKKHVLAPLAVADDGLRVLTPAPADVDALRRLGELLEIELQPVLAPEFRVWQRIQHLYGAPPSERFRALLDRYGERPGQPPRRGSSNAGAGPRGSRPSQRRPSSIPAARRSDPPKLSFGQAVTLVSEASGPEPIAKTTVAYSGQWLRFVALLRVDGPRITGWRARGPQADRVPGLAFDLQDESTFRTVIDTRAHYLGPLPSDQVQTHFIGPLMRPTPRTVLIVPIRAQGETVALLYGDNGDHTLSPRLAADLMLFITHVQAALDAQLAPAPLADDRAEPDIRLLPSARPSGPAESRLPIPPAADDSEPPTSTGHPRANEPLDSDAPIPLLDDSSPPSQRERQALEAGLRSAVGERSEAPDSSRRPREPTTEPAALFQGRSVRTDDAATMPTAEDGRFDAAEYRAAVVAERADGSDLVSVLDDIPEVEAELLSSADDSEGWAPVAAESWDDSAVSTPPASSTPTPIRSSLNEDATVPDLSAEAWIRASSEAVRPRPLPAEVVLRSELPAPDSAADQPVPLTRVARATVPVGQLRVPVVEEAEGDFLDFEDVLIESGPPADPSQDPSQPTALGPLDAAHPQNLVVDPARPQTVSEALEQLTSIDPARRAAAADLLAKEGSAALPMVIERFPGVLDVDPFTPDVQLPAFSRCGATLSLLELSGRESHRYVIRKLDAPDPLHRFFATYFYAAVYVPEAIPKLIQRLHDEEPRICMLAARTLFSYRDHQSFSLVLEHLHGRLTASSLAARRHAAYLIGLFRDVTAIPELIDILSKRERDMQDVVEDALAEITKQRLGRSPKKWRTWWTKHQHRSRIEWLLEGLASRDAALRASASDELKAVTGMDLGFDGAASRRQREEARQRWLKWWKAQQAKRTAVTLARAP